MSAPSAAMKTLLIFVICCAILDLKVFAEDEFIETEENENTLNRKKRAIVADLSLRWPKGIIPFVLTSSITPDALKEIKRSMTSYERFTCLRFVPWTPETSKKYDLGHNGYLRFHKDKDCNAALGNKKDHEGQYISCCDGTKCMHELGHAIGFIHEHQSPEREGWIRMNNANIQPGELQWFLPLPASEVITDGFDIQSVMMYPPGAKRIDGKGLSYNYLWPELHYGKNFFYLFKQIATAYKCADHCQNFKLECVNDGFLTHVEGKCACNCPQGLDPATGCKDILKDVPKGTALPGGSWSIPETNGGCPGGLEEGFFSHNTDKDGVNKKSTSYNLKGVIADYYAEHYFCMNKGSAGDEKVFWEDGNYCIYPVGGTCPPIRPNDVEGANFHPGIMDFFDYIDLTHVNNKSSNLPDGTFKKDQTGFIFCCRDSGFLNQPMYLPNKKPLALYTPQYTFGCQEIFGMHHSEEWVALNSMNYQEATYYGDTPFAGSTKGIRRMNVKHCYYEPAKTDCGAVINLDESNPTHTFTMTKEDQVDCQWLIKAPEKSRIKLDLVDMNIRGTMPDKCVDYLSVRAVRMGQNGIHYCGAGLGHSIISHHNSMMMNFATFKDSSSVFTAKLSFVKDEELCYNTADKGASYVGKVSWTRTFVPCVPWNKVTHCPHHAFNSADLGKNLFSNFCRNPGAGQQPWCYTDPVECKRDYCDVCQIGSRFDKPGEDCVAFKAAGKCSSDPLAIEKCAKTCEAETAVGKAGSVKSVTCPKPPAMFDGKLTTAAKATYKVGEKVTFKCTRMKKSKQATTDRICLSDGTWSEAAYSCGRCDAGWTLHLGLCYKYFDTKLNRAEAVKVCRKTGRGKIAAAKNAKKNTFLQTLRPVGTTIYLGAKSPSNTKTWYWPDLTKTDLKTSSSKKSANWKTGYPKFFMFPEQCLVLDVDGKWIDNPCVDPYTFICEKKRYKQNFCKNYLSNASCNLIGCNGSADFRIKTCMKTCKYCK